MHEETLDNLIRSKHRITVQNAKEKQKKIEQLLQDMDKSKSSENLHTEQAQEALLSHYVELMKHKFQIEQLLSQHENVTDEPYSEFSALQNKQEALVEEFQKVS